MISLHTVLECGYDAYKSSYLYARARSLEHSHTHTTHTHTHKRAIAQNNGCGTALYINNIINATPFYFITIEGCYIILTQCYFFVVVFSSSQSHLL